MITLYILHAGITHPSPYFYNFNLEIKKYNNFNVIINPELPNFEAKGKSIIYFNRLKRFYKSDNIETANSFLESVDILKQKGWKIVFSLHNFFPIDREITYVDDYVTNEFLKKCDIVFTLSEFLKKQIKKYYNIEAINHGMGFNVLDNNFNKNVIKDFKKKNFVFTFVGNIYEYKMLDRIIENFKKFKNCSLIIAGKEPKNANVNLSSLIMSYKNIYFYNDFIGDNDWKKIADVTDCFINIYNLDFPPFKYGFFPSNFINIYNTGIQCISPKCDIIEEMMDKEQMIYYDFYSKTGLLDAMNQAITNKKKILKNDVKAKFDWEKVISIFTKNCEELFK